MNRKELQRLWTDTLLSREPTPDKYERLVAAVVDAYQSDRADFGTHIKNRFPRVTEATGQKFDPDDFDIDMARAFVADENGFGSWDELISAVQNPAGRKYPLLFQYAIVALWRGDFTTLERTIGGPEVFDRQAIEWYEAGLFSDEQQTLDELFSAACWLGHTRTAEYLLDKGVDPYAGMRTGLAGFHWAASSGKLDVINLLLQKKVPTEIKSMYESTPLGQALWSAINEHTENHAAIVESLIEGGAHVWPETLEWWQKQDVPSAETKERVADALRRHESKIGN